MATVEKKVTLFDAVLVAVMVLASALFLYPMIITLVTSVSVPEKLLSNTVYFLPYGFSLETYKLLLGEKSLFLGYGNTILYAGLGTVLMLLITSMMAYALTYPEFKAKGLLSALLLITMFFGGGMVPSYLNIMKLGLLNTVTVMVLPGAISAYNTFVFRAFFKALPPSLHESAMIDGAGHFRILFSIVLPLSKALLATFSLFCVVSHWNDFLSALLYLEDPDRYPVQMFLRKILVSVSLTDSIDNYDLAKSLQEVNTRTVQSAAVIITVLPVLCVYPFLQKYFAKGVMVGSVKG